MHNKMISFYSERQALKRPANAKSFPRTRGVKPQLISLQS